MGKALGVLVREERRRDGLSQQQLSQMAGLSQTTISQVEKGVLIPSETSLGRIAKALRILESHIRDAIRSDEEPESPDGTRHRTPFLNSDQEGVIATLHRRRQDLTGLRIFLLARAPLAANDDETVRLQMATLINEGATYTIVWFSDEVTVDDFRSSVTALEDVVNLTKWTSPGTIINHYLFKPWHIEGTRSGYLGAAEFRDFARTHSLRGQAFHSKPLNVLPSAKRVLSSFTSRTAPVGVYGFADSSEVEFANVGQNRLADRPNGVSRKGEFRFVVKDDAQELYAVLTECIPELPGKLAAQRKAG